MEGGGGGERAEEKEAVINRTNNAIEPIGGASGGLEGDANAIPIWG